VKSGGFWVADYRWRVNLNNTGDFVVSFFRVFVFVFSLVSASVPEAQQQTRARDLGIAPGTLRPGAYNAITDVAGVRVGQTTLLQGDSVRTGVTAILPHPGNLFFARPLSTWATDSAS
jgi:D-aminopeptidase